MPPQNHDASASGGGSSAPGPPREKFLTHLSMDEDSDRDADRARILDEVDSASEVNGVRDASTAEFLLRFARSSGPPQIIALCLVIALALGSTVGVVPAVVGDRYARLRHGYAGELCSDLAGGGRPHECLSGTEDAQNAAAMSSFASNALTFATSPLMGSISDERGRRGIMLLGIGLSLLAPLCLVLMQLFESMDPFLYYASHALAGLVSWMAVALSALSDVTPPIWRAPAFGLVLAGFAMGLSLSPLLAVGLSHLGVSVFALGVLMVGFVFACVALPETLSPDASERARLKRLAERPASDAQSRIDSLKYSLLRPMKELSILNRNMLFRLLSALAFFSGCVTQANYTLLLYYIEENLGFDERDVAIFFLVSGTTGVFVQTVVLKPLNSLVGERRIIMLAFSVGALHEFMYGIARSKWVVILSAAISSLTGMSFPTISAIKANNVDELEQGRIQGALYSLSSLASALGPMMLSYVYHLTKDGGGLGKGTMFVFGAGLYLAAAACAWLLPEEDANSGRGKDAGRGGDPADPCEGDSVYGATDRDGAQDLL